LCLGHWEGHLGVAAQGRSTRLEGTTIGTPCFNRHGGHSWGVIWVVGDHAEASAMRQASPASMLRAKSRKEAYILVLLLAWGCIVGDKYFSIFFVSRQV